MPRSTPALRFRTAWTTYTRTATMAMPMANEMPLWLKNDRPFFEDWMIGLIPANQYTVAEKISQIAPKTGSHVRQGAERIRSFRERGATRAFTPGITQVSNASRMLNHAVPARLSLPDPSDVSPCGSNGKICRNIRI